MASFEFDHARVQHTAAQMDALLLRLQQQEEELLQLASEIGRNEGQALQAAAVRRCAESVQHRAGEMKHCRTVLGSIADKVFRTEALMDLLEITGPRVPKIPPRWPAPASVITSPLITPHEATDLGLYFEESR